MKSNQTPATATAAREALEAAIDERDALKPEYRKAINPNVSMSAQYAQSVEQNYTAANEKVKAARKVLLAATRAESTPHPTNAMAAKSDKATARPWRLHDCGHPSVMSYSEPKFICSCSDEKSRDEQFANAALIVEAVNEHAALVQVAEAAQHAEDLIADYPPKTVARLGIRAALANLAAVRGGGK